MKLDFQQKIITGLVILLAVGALFGAFKRYQYQKQIVHLQNAAAERDKTIEVQKGVFEKLTIQVKDANDLLNTKDKQLSELANELKHSKEQLLSFNTIAVAWKKAYEASIAGKQTVVPAEGGKTRTKVEFQKDFGYIGVNGYTLTDPAEAFVHVQQNRPLKISLAVAQDKDRAWHTYATSSEENVGVDIALTGVNPLILEPKWYEKIGVTSAFGLGLGNQGAGVLLGVGASYQFGKYEVGPSVWLSATNGLTKYYGGTFTWHPFAVSR